MTLKLSKEEKQEIAKKLNDASAEQKSDVIIETFAELNELAHQDLIREIMDDSSRSSADSEYREKLKLRTLSKEENDFYEILKTDPKQALTAKQIDIIPQTMVDLTLEDVRERSRIAELIDFAPSTVSKWILAEKSATYSWGKLDSELKETISGTIKVLNYELGKMYAVLILPKQIRALSNEFVDKYFMAILNEAVYDGIDYSYINGTGADMPIGITKLTDTKNEDGTAKDKTVRTDIKGFSPKHMKNVKKILTNNGKRVIEKLYLICNPSDQYEYVEPALYGETLGGGYIQKTPQKIEVIPCVECKQGVGIFTIPHKYKMGFSGIKLNEYKETLAMDDADLIICTLAANGRAVDDNTSVPFDITKLEEYVPTFKTVTESNTPPAA